MPRSSTSRALQPSYHFQPHFSFALDDPDSITAQIADEQLAFPNFENVVRVRLVLSLGIGTFSFVREFEFEWFGRRGRIEGTVLVDGDEKDLTAGVLKSVEGNGMGQ